MFCLALKPLFYHFPGFIVILEVLPTEVSFKTGGSHSGPGTGNRVGATIPQIHLLSKPPLQPVLCEQVLVVKQQGCGCNTYIHTYTFFFFVFFFCQALLYNKINPCQKVKTWIVYINVYITGRWNLKTKPNHTYTIHHKSLNYTLKYSFKI